MGNDAESGAGDDEEIFGDFEDIKTGEKFSGRRQKKGLNAAGEDDDNEDEDEENDPDVNHWSTGADAVEQENEQIDMQLREVCCVNNSKTVVRVT
jgi:hypothetical protein